MQSRKILQTFIHELDVCDPFHSYSRIDYFLVSNQLFPQIYDTKYETIVISDHGPVKLIYDMTKIIKGSCRWRLHPKWLHDTNFLEFVGTNIDEFFKINTNETSASVRWEAFKLHYLLH